MGILCMILGSLTFLGMTGLGWYFAQSLINLGLAAAFVAYSTTQIYAFFMGIFGGIGLIIGLALFVAGLAYNNSRKRK